MEIKEVHRFYLLHSQISKLFGISPTLSDFSGRKIISATPSHKLIEKMVEYAIAGMDNNLFVSTYMLQLPDKDTLEKLIKDEMQNMNEQYSKHDR